MTPVSSMETVNQTAVKDFRIYFGADSIMNEYRTPNKE
jgi:hypothetical protein